MSSFWKRVLGVRTQTKVYLWNPTSEKFVSDGCGNPIDFETPELGERARKLYGKELVVQVFG